jgi:plasmid stability protein
LATLTIRDLDESLKRNLRMRAASRNRSMEEEARQILRAALVESAAPADNLVSRVRARFVGLGDVALSVPMREPVRTPPSFDEGEKTARAAPTKGRTRARRRA